ncbi:MAG TPA: flavodoxin family protein [Candidatus Pelethocola excrementipullorum]|nr:flavodoxin family protein [Candidatus Pelethocola excrementipullorum]
MKVLLINGSPHAKGSTFSALSVVEKVLNNKGIQTEQFHIGTKMIRGCIDCKKCSSTYRCVFDDDPCNALIDAMVKADGVIIGSPVYFAGPNGALCALLDRVFYAASTHGRLLAGKPAAAVASCYRAGATATLDRLNKYFTFSEMPVISSHYWNMVFEPDSSVAEDRQGHSILVKLGENMASYLKRN